ncbi:MAG: hypothetical protein WDN49_21815 [Acetobacteraceae bacterium]
MPEVMEAHRMAGRHRLHAARRHHRPRLLRQFYKRADRGGVAEEREFADEHGAGEGHHRAAPAGGAVPRAEIARRVVPGGWLCKNGGGPRVSAAGAGYSGGSWPVRLTC